MFYVIVVLHNKLICLSIFFSVSRKDREFLFLLDAVHVDGNVVEVFKFFYLSQRHRKLNVLHI